MTREEKVAGEPIQADLEFLAYFYDYLEWLSGQPHLNTGNTFFHQLQARIGELDTNLRSVTADERESLIGYLHDYLFIVMVKAVKISVTCAICKSVCEKLSLKFREAISLNQTVKHVDTLQGHVLEILGNLNDPNMNKQLTFKGDLDLYMRKVMVHKLVQYLLKDCDEMVTLCENAVTEKARTESLFFKVACWSVGALCAGRLLYAVYENVGLEKMVKTGLWVTCAGLTAAVLHIPCMELNQILELTEYNKEQCITMMAMVKPWLRNLPLSTHCNGLNSPLLTRTC